MLQRGFLLAISKGEVLPTLTLVHDSRCCKQLFFCPLARGESYPPKLYCMTPDVANDFPLPISKGGDLPTQTLVHDSRCCNQLFSCNDTRFLSKTQLIMINQSNAGRFDPKVFVNCVFSCPLARGASYPPKIKCMTPDVASDFFLVPICKG